MEYRKALFIVAYAEIKKGLVYAILKRRKHWIGWEFPKGGIDPGEKELQTVKREIFEETGQKSLKIDEFDFSGKYEYSKEFSNRPGIIGQTYKLFAVKIKKEKLKIDKKEHSDGKWLSYEKALKKLTHKNQKQALKIVNEFLNEKKFRKFILSSGRKVLVGKSDFNNEELINQISSEEDVFHTAKPGSAFVNIKGESSKKDIKETAIICAAKSQDFRDNQSDVDVHWFKGKDIYKKKNMKIGTFGLKDFKLIKIPKKEIKEWLKKNE